MSDQLRDQIGRLDPMHSGVPTESVTTPSSRARLEHIMSTPTIERPAAPSRLFRYTAAAAVAVVAVAVGVITFTGGDDPKAVTGPPLELTLGAEDTMAMCLPVEVQYLTGMELAFEGTVDSVDGETVTVTVDRWFRGGDATQVRLQAPAGMQALIGGIDFVEGGQYLITATEGTVNYCGFSDVATPQLRAMFEQAFSG